MTENDVDGDVCVRCTPSAMPEVFRHGTPRQGPGHVGVRFDDGGRARVWLDGVDVTENGVWEAIEGDPGYVLVRLTDDLHISPIDFMEHFRIVIRRGVVRVDWLGDVG